MPRILVVEDEPDIVAFLQRGLLHHGFEVVTATSGAQALALAGSTRPDLVVLDLMLPDMDGLEVCGHLRDAGNPGVIILTARHLVGDRVRGLEAGADDYLPKPFAFEELLARVRSVLRRQGRVQGEIHIGDLVVDTERRQVRRGDRTLELTNREFELLCLLAQSAGKPLRREKIVQHLWGYDFEGETDPVKVYVNRLRRKLNAAGEPELIHALRGYGYVLREQP